MASFGVFPSTKPTIKSASSLPASSPRSPHLVSPKFPPPPSSAPPRSSTTSGPKRGNDDSSLIKSLHQQIYLLELETRFLRSNKSLAEKETHDDVIALRRKFTDQLAARDARVADLEAQLALAHAATARQSARVATLTNDLDTQSRAHARALADVEAQVGAKAAEITRLTAALTRARHVGDSAATHVVHAQASLAAALADVAAARAESDALRTKCDAHAAQLVDMQAKLDLALPKQASAQEEVARVQALWRASESATAQAQAQARQAEVALASAAEARARVDSELQRALEECAQLTLKLGTAEADLARVQRQLEAKETAQVGANEAVARRVKELEAHVETLQAAAAVRSKELAHLRDELATRDRLVVQLREEVAVESERAAAEAALAASLRGDVTSAVKDVAELRAQVGGLEARVAVAERERDQGWDEVAKAKAQVREWTQKAKVWARAEEVVKGVPLEGLAELRRALEQSERQQAAAADGETGHSPRAGV